MSVFESLPLINRGPVFLPQHLTRLRAACAQRGFAIDGAALDAIEALLRNAPFDGFARIYVTAGDGAVSANPDRPRMLVFVESRDRPSESVYQRGYSLDVSPEAVSPLFGGLKTGNYWRNVEALRTAVAAGHDESLLVNPSGAVISACTANAFVILEGMLCTPPLNDGARAGVIRHWVMNRCTVSERTIRLDDIRAAEGMFLTSSWLGVMPVGSAAGRPMPKSPVANELRKEYIAELNEFLARG
jgi:branched-subunit amino acid aminotransferase/4-amino-4-deoxychorismate lyase